MPRVCIHLNKVTDSDYARYFTGDGTDHALVCLLCRDKPESIEGNLCLVSPERFTQIEEGGCWDWDKNAIVGRPEIRERPTGLSFIHHEVDLSELVSGEVAALQPVPANSNGECLLLTVDGTLFRVDPVRVLSDRLMNLPAAGISFMPKFSLHVSPCGEIAAIVEASGQRGAVVDLIAGTTTMSLDRGDYHPEQSEFPIAFSKPEDALRWSTGRVGIGWTSPTPEPVNS